MKILPLIVALALSTVSCTKQGQTKAAQYTDAAGAICGVVVQATDPALAPLCTTADNVAKAIEALVAQTAASNAAAGAPTAAIAPPTNDEIYNWLVQHGASAAR